ncbi:MAG: transcription-repair coupling factor [Pirellulales bacterium]|nr:transcription-repair coupling factor [Pirellulales bacterium]
MTPVAEALATDRLHELASALCRQTDFAEVVAALQEGQAATLGGVWGSSCALIIAALLESGPPSVVVVLPHASQVDDFVDDLALFGNWHQATFPATECGPNDRNLFDELAGQRIRVLKRLSAPGAKGAVTGQFRIDSDGSMPWQPPLQLVATSIQALLQCVPSRIHLEASTRRLVVGEWLDVDELTAWFIGAGFRHTAAVELPGEFAHRGGILDLFLADAEDPVRIELFGDEIESIRRFSVDTQRSIGRIDAVDVTALSQQCQDNDHLASYLPAGSWILLVEPEEINQEARYFLERADRPQDVHPLQSVLASLYAFPSITASGVPSGSTEKTCHLAIESVERFSGDIHRVAEELDTASGQDDIYLVCETEAESERLRELFGKTRTAKTGRLHFVPGRLKNGFRLITERVVVVSGAELFQRQDLARRARRRLGRTIDSFLDLRAGDLVVHLSHGIGRYRGLVLLNKDDCVEEHLEIEFHGGTTVYVPSSKIELVQKYVGGTKNRPKLARIGGRMWIRQKRAAEAAVTDLASELIDLQATRSARPGITFPPDTEWQHEFDASFTYQETPDQLVAMDAIKEDMLQQRPMDRLLCGDVGFGKTELALRAAFKAVDAGYQVGLLVPTTILAEQHYRTFRQRMAEFPFEIAVLSRFATKKQQREIIERLAAGSLDIVIGTHRLAQKDVTFANLGLIIIDEEQRFGVAIKERLKAFRATVDVLTMTATPIPRTLHFSLLGIRDISNLETPPEDRLAIETRVARFNEELIRRAVLRELNRGGQIFFVHNRVQDIHAVAEKLEEIVPEATIAIGHGQMPEHELENVMLQFLERRCDILLATTIVESGLDIPNANTIFINDADRYGLADLHQLRGRVGRYKHRAYCYLLIAENKSLTPQSARRLRAIEEFSQMGAGFAISMRDLELRGAGNILGTQQSGHIATVGYELYCNLLENAVRRMKQLPLRESVDVHIDLPGEAFLPTAYVPDMRLKIDLYRRLARLNRLESLKEFAAELADRFGPPPPLVERLLERAELRILAHRHGIGSIHIENPYVVLGYTSRQQIAAVAAANGEKLRIVDSKSAYLPVGKEIIEQGHVPQILKSLLQQV